MSFQDGDNVEWSSCVDLYPSLWTDAQVFDHISSHSRAMLGTSTYNHTRTRTFVIAAAPTRPAPLILIHHAHAARHDRRPLLALLLRLHHLCVYVMQVMREWGVIVSSFLSRPSTSSLSPPLHRPLLHSLFQTPTPLHLPLDSLVEEERYRFRMSALDLADAMVWLRGLLMMKASC